jgi:N-acyl-L-homoserine lactone synthetase
MLLQVEGHQAEQYEPLFSRMFEHRKRIFFDDKKWEVNVVNGRYEIDEYDRQDTCYLLSLDRRGELMGSVRLISTVMPHMMSGPFRDMFPDVCFSSPLIWEATRFAVVGDAARPNQVSAAACELMLGVVQFALDNGIQNIVGVYDAAMARLYRRCGFATIELKRFRTAQHGTVYAGLCPISQALEASVLAATGLLPDGAGEAIANAA